MHTHTHTHTLYMHIPSHIRHALNIAAERVRKEQLNVVCVPTSFQVSSTVAE